MTVDRFCPHHEACSSSYHFVWLLIKAGHNVKIIPPQYVKPYVQTNKTDAADAEAIREAVSRHTMRFVQIKTAEQQAVYRTYCRYEHLAYCCQQRTRFFSQKV